MSLQARGTAAAAAVIIGDRASKGCARTATQIVQSHPQPRRTAAPVQSQQRLGGRRGRVPSSDASALHTAAVAGRRGGRCHAAVAACGNVQHACKSPARHSRHSSRHLVIAAQRPRGQAVGGRHLQACGAQALHQSDDLEAIHVLVCAREESSTGRTVASSQSAHGAVLSDMSPSAAPSGRALASPPTAETSPLAHPHGSSQAISSQSTVPNA